MPNPSIHHWYSPAEIALQLDAHQHGATWRACCPVHGGENLTSLHITEGVARDGTPMTLLHCFAHQCPIDAICAALGIPIAGLWAIRPDAPRRPYRASPLPIPLRQKGDHTPFASDDIIETLLHDEIYADTAWFLTCPGARETCWRLGQDVQRKFRLSASMAAAGLRVAQQWADLAREATHGSFA